MSCNRGRQARRKWSHNLGTPWVLVRWLWTLLCSWRNTWTWNRIQLLRAGCQGLREPGCRGCFSLVPQSAQHLFWIPAKGIFFLYSVKAGLAMKLCAQILKIKSIGWIAVFRSSPSHWVAETSRRDQKCMWYFPLSIHIYSFNLHVFYSSLLFIICISDMNL